MSSISDSIESIESKIKRLAGQLERLKAENKQLKQENAELRLQHSSSRQHLDLVSDRLTEQRERLVPDPTDSTMSSEELRKQIDHYVKEIDACIAWLSKQE